MPKKIFQLKITVKEFTPKIWRRIQVDSDTLLSDLHKIIQTSMGWTNSHLHQFIKNKRLYSLPSEDDDEVGAIDSQGVKLSALLKKQKDRMVYEYDFGDGWIHDVMLEEILPADGAVKYPICLNGEMHCPPDDCGGTWGYADMLKILKDKTHEEYESYITWLGGSFDPHKFDLKTVNRKLKQKQYGCIEILEF